MKTLFSSAKRCLALVLAVLLLIPVMAAPAFASDVQSVTVGQIMAGFGGWTETEMHLLSSGELADVTINYQLPTDEDDLISVDPDTKTVTAETFVDSWGQTWVPAYSKLYPNGSQEPIETWVVWTADGEDWKYTYTSDPGNAFYVDVRYILQVSGEDFVNAQQSLLDTMEDLRAGYDALQGLYSQDGYLKEFEARLPELADAAENGIETGFVNPQFNMLFPYSKIITLSDETVAVILNLRDQANANGGLLDLRVKLAEYAAGSAIDYLMNGDVDGLLSDTEELVADLGVIYAELASQSERLQTVIDLLNDNKDSWNDYGVVQEDVDNLINTVDTVDTMAKAVNVVKGYLADAVDTTAVPGWNVDLTGKLAAGVDYAHLDEHVIALGEGYQSSWTVIDSAVAADTYLRANTSMYDVTLEFYISTVVGKDVVVNNLTHGITLTLMENATAAEIEAAIAASGVQKAAEELWAQAGLFVDGQFDIIEPEIPETLTKDVTLTYSYTPKMYTVNGAELIGIAPMQPYGYQIVLPIHEDITKAYDYKVNDVPYAQGSVIIVDRNLTITRTEGRAYTTHSLFRMISDQFGSGEYVLLGTRALTVKDEIVAVRYPTNADDLVKVNGTKVTAGTFNSDYAGQIWAPVSVDVYYNNELVETQPMTNGEAAITSDNFDYVSVNYELVLTNITHQQMVDVLNLAIDLKNEAAAQRECMSILADNLEYLQMLDRTMLGIIKGLAEQYCYPETVAAVVFLQENCLNTTNKLYLTEYLEFYTSDNGGLWYYYQDGNWAKIKAEVDKMLPYMQLIKDDPGIKTALEVGVGGVSYGDKYDAIPALVEALTNAKFTGPNEVINLQSSFLQEFIDALDNWEPERLTHYAPDELTGYLTLNTNLTKTSDTKVQVLINVDVKNKFGESTTASYGPFLYNVGVTLDDDHKQEILEGVKALLNSIDPYYSNIYVYEFGVEGSNLETELMKDLSGALNGDVVLYYSWNEICYHQNCIPATCTTPALCEVCGEYVGEPDPNNHNWDEGVVDTEPTCTENGWTLYTCSWCHAEELREDIPATGHAWTEWKDVADDDVDHWRYCLNGCGATEHENHVWNEGKVTTPATCETDGVLTYTCSVCGGQYTEVIPATGHSFTNYIYNNDATCTEDGTQTAKCDNGCGKTDTIAAPGTALGHDFSGICHDYDEEGHAYQCIRCDVIEEARHPHIYEGTDCAAVDFCTECQHEKPAGSHAWGAWKDNGDGTHTRECTLCDEGIETAEHTWGTGVVTTPATCTEDGVMTYTCTACGATKTEVIPATGHSYGEWTSDGEETHSRVCATCGDVETENHTWTEWTTDGQDTHSRTCTVCGEVQTAEHSWDDGVITTPTSCEVPGVMTYTCTVCGESFTTSIPETGHSFTNYVSDGNATCTEDGTKTAVCDNGCGKTDTVADPGTALGHDFTGEWVSCGAEGHAHKCIRCDVIEEGRYAHNFDNDACDESATCIDCSYVKPAGEHSWGEWVDNGDGTHTRTCVSGDDSQTAEHTWGTGVVTSPATCTEDGEMTYTCTACGAVKTEVIPATGHSWSDWTHDDDNTHSRICSVCEETETEYHAWGVGEVTKPATITETGVLTYTCSVCEHVKTEEIPVVPPTGSSSVTSNSKREVVVNLGGDQGSIRYDLLYTIVVDGFEVQVTVSNNMLYPFNLNSYFAEHYLDQFPDLETMNQFLYSAYLAYVNGDTSRISVTYGLIDSYSNQLYDFVRAMDSAANGALDFSLLNHNGNFSIVANVSSVSGVASNLMGVAQTFLFSGYSYISINTVDGFVPFFADSRLSLQALVDGLLAEDGFGTNTIIELSKGNAASVPGDVVVDGGKIGGFLQKTQMKIGTDASAIQYTVDFYLTMSDTAQLARIADALNGVKNYVTAETKNGEMFIKLTLPEKVYEVYLALMLATGEVDKSDVNAIESAIAFRFLYDYLDLILNTGATTETFENTLAMLGQSYDLSSYETYYQTLKELLLTGSTDAMGGDVVANLDLNKDEAKGTLDLIANAKTLLDTVLAKAGMGGMEMELDLLIKEYHNDEDLTVTAKAELSEAKPAFQVAVIDIRNGSVLNKADFATDGVSRINSLAGEAAVILLADITGDLVINDVTILDLNGYTITGNIVANGALVIVDSSLDSDECGGVDGDISGNVTIIAGNYTDTVSGYLADGYAQNGTAVTNALYTIDVDGEGNVSVIVNSDVMDEVADGYIPSIRELAVDLAVDLVLNYITSAALSVDGEMIYAVNLTDAVALLKSEQKVENAIDELLTYIDVDGGITTFVNNVIDDLMAFDVIADGIKNGTPVATYNITTKPWQIYVGHETDGDYIKFGITNNAGLEKSFDLSLVITGENAETYLLPVVEELAEIVTKKDIEVQLYQPLYDNKILHNVGGTFSADVALDLTNEYPVVLAIILAYSGVDMGDDLNAVLAAYQNDPSCAVQLKDEIDEVTIAQLIAALKAMNRANDFTDMAKKAGIDLKKIDIGLTAMLQRVYHLVLVGSGAVLDYLEIFGGNQTLGSLERTSGVYAVDKENINRTGSYTHSSGYGIAYDLSATEIALSVKLFDTCKHVYTGVVTDPTCTEQGYTTYTCVCGDSYVADYVDATGHNWSVSWSWSADYSTATATFTCGNDAAHVETVDATVSSATVGSDCDAPGSITYTATVEFEGETYTDVKTVEVDSIGHAWGEPVWSWSADYSTATATFTCGNDATHVEIVDATVSSVTVDPDCTTPGSITYTATVVFEGETYTDSKTVTGAAATGHAWGEPVWSWNADYSTATATFACGNDATHVEIVDATVSSVTVDPDCTTPGSITYTATVVFEGETYTDSKTVTGASATGHAWGKWTDNGDGKTHSRVCANDPSHIETLDHNFGGDNICDDCGYDKSPSTPVYPPIIPTPGHCPACGQNICHSLAFSDLNVNSWYHLYTDYVLCKGLMIGKSATEFVPGGETNRAMLVTTLYRFAGSPAVTGDMPYTDVAEGQWYSDAIIWATQNGIVNGYGNDVFGPFDTLTREQSATIFYRYAKLLGLDVTGSDDELAKYSDVAQISTWAVDGVKWAVTSGMMNGRSTTELILRPKNGTTRAETAALLYRWCEEIAD